MFFQSAQNDTGSDKKIEEVHVYRSAAHTNGGKPKPMPMQAPTLTPPSPPSSNPSPDLQEFPGWQKVSDVDVAPPLSRDKLETALNVRPLTPPVDSIQTTTKVAVPRTPESSPFKRHGTDIPLSQKNDSNGAPVKGSLPLSRTPDRHNFIDLSTPKRSLPRQRPSKDFVIPNGSLEVDKGIIGPAASEDPSPSKSHRSYFSLPGSPESSPIVHRFGGEELDSSPLNQFTQNPSFFAPVAESTQIRRLGSFQSSPIPQRALLHNSSGVLGPYNSQFNVNDNVDRFRALMEKDVDFNAWVQDLDEDIDNDDPRTSEGQLESMNAHSP